MADGLYGLSLREPAAMRNKTLALVPYDKPVSPVAMGAAVAEGQRLSELGLRGGAG